MIFTIPWEVGVTLGSVGRISRALGLAVAAVWILSVMLAGVRRPGPVQKAYFAFVLWSGATYFWSVDPTASLLQAVTYVQLLGMVLVLWDLFDDERAVKAALQAYVYGAFVTAGSVIVQFLTSPPARFAEHARYIGLGTEIDGIGLIVAAAAPRHGTWRWAPASARAHGGGGGSISATSRRPSSRSSSPGPEVRRSRVSPRSC